MLAQLIQALLSPPPFYSLVDDTPQQKDQQPQRKQKEREHNV